MSAEPAEAVWTERGHYLFHQDAEEQTCRICQSQARARELLLAEYRQAPPAHRRRRVTRGDVLAVLFIVTAGFAVAAMAGPPGNGWVIYTVLGGFVWCVIALTDPATRKKG